MPKFQVTLYRTVTDLEECTVEIECESTEFKDIVAKAVEYASREGIEPNWGQPQPLDSGPIDPGVTCPHDVREIG
jgi:hypothetical protein